MLYNGSYNFTKVALKDTALWIVGPVEGPGHQLRWVGEPAPTYLTDRWKTLGQRVGEAPIPAIGG